MYRLLCAIVTLNVVGSSRILAVFPIPAISHQIVFRPLTQELARRGHEVVIVTPNPAFKDVEAPENITEIDIHEISYNFRKKVQAQSAVGTTEYQMFKAMYFSFVDIFDIQLKDENFKRLVKSKEKFDLIFTESCVPVSIGLSHVFKAPVIQISSLTGTIENFRMIGSPSHIFLYPSVLQKKLFNLTLWEKLSHLYTFFRLEIVRWQVREYENEVIKKNFGKDAPTVNELAKNISLLMVNVNPIWDDNRPVPPGVVYIGGVQQVPPKPIPKELETYLNSSSNGVIYLSFGTSVQTNWLSGDKIKIFCKVLGQLKYDVLWKWNEEDPPCMAENVRASKWFPQVDMLKHPKIKLFITQGGIQSTEESIIAGVPLIAIPMISDQWYNAEMYVKHGIGVRLEFMTIEEETLRLAIEDVLGNKSYKKNIAKLRSIIYDQPVSPLERAVWWTEHVLQHGAKHLRSPLADATWANYLMLDVVLVLLMFLAVIIAVVVLILRVVLNFVKVIFIPDLGSKKFN